MDERGRANLQWSATLIQLLVGAGVRRFVISPGSRSTPLALAVSRNPNTEQWIIIDERDAAFFALGQARESQQATALICTSGSAVANWLPAVVEANHSATPLLLLSADRPPELHHCGANQTIEQQNLFGEQVRASLTTPPPDEIEEPIQQLSPLISTLIRQMTGPIPGPVHLNIPFREPLLPTNPDTVEWNPTLQGAAIGESAAEQSGGDLERLHREIQGGSGLILCGESHYPESFYPLLLQLAGQLGCMIVADPLSNLRWGHEREPRLLAHHDALFRNHSLHEQFQPEWIIQFGRFPISSSVARYLEQYPPQQFITVHYRQLWSDPLSLSTHRVEMEPSRFCRALLNPGTSENSLPADNRILTALERSAAGWKSGERLLDEHQILQRLRQQLPAETTLFSGNSMVIRDIDSWLAPRRRPLRLIANRGASGIDGNLATVCGIRSTTPAEHPVVALLGDLTLFHNLNALHLAKEINLNLTIIVINNGGGNIFSHLPQSTLPEFERLWLTPTSVDFSAAATLYGIEYSHAGEPDAFEQQLVGALRQSHANLIELEVQRSVSNRVHQQYWESLQ